MSSFKERNRPTGNPSEFADGCGCIFLAGFVSLVVASLGLAIFAALHWR